MPKREAFRAGRFQFQQFFFKISLMCTVGRNRLGTGTAIPQRVVAVAVPNFGGISGSGSAWNHGSSGSGLHNNYEPIRNDDLTNKIQNQKYSKNCAVNGPIGTIESNAGESGRKAGK